MFACWSELFHREGKTNDVGDRIILETKCFSRQMCMRSNTWRESSPAPASFPSYLPVGLHPTGLQALQLSSVKTKERAWRHWQRYQCFFGWGDLTHPRKKGPGATPPLCTADSSQDMAAIFTSWGRRRWQFIGVIDIRLAYQLPGEPSVGQGQLLIKPYD